MGCETIRESLKPKRQQRHLGKIHEEEDFISEDSSDNFDDRLSKKLEKQSKNPRRTSFVEARKTEFAAPNAKQRTEKEEIVTKEMPKDEAKRLMSSIDFINWFSKSSRHVERALSCEFDIQEEFFMAEETEKSTADDV